MVFNLMHDFFMLGFSLKGTKRYNCDGDSSNIFLNSTSNRNTLKHADMQTYACGKV